MMLRLAALACGVALALLAGCASFGLTPYPNELPGKNLSIRTTTSTRSTFSSVRAALEVYSVDAQCRTQYLGTVELDKPSVAVGIPADRWSYLVFDFASSGFLGGTRGRISRGMLLKPQADYRYEIDVTYLDDMYNVILRERLPRGVLRELPLPDLASCRRAGSRSRVSPTLFAYAGARSAGKDAV
jgi:hypothetical protein